MVCSLHWTLTRDDYPKASTKPNGKMSSTASGGTPGAGASSTVWERPSTPWPVPVAGESGVNGSFVTAKEEPGDFDACWDPEGVNLDALDPVLLDMSGRRVAQKARFGGELLPNVVEAGSGLSFVEFFQNERDTTRKGIVMINIGGEQ